MVSKGDSVERIQVLQSLSAFKLVALSPTTEEATATLCHLFLIFKKKAFHFAVTDEKENLWIEESCEGVWFPNDFHLWFDINIKIKIFPKLTPDQSKIVRASSSRPRYMQTSDDEIKYI